MAVVVAMAVAWWLDRRAVAIQRDQAQATINHLEGLEKELAWTLQKLKWKVEADKRLSPKSRRRCRDASQSSGSLCAALPGVADESLLLAWALCRT
jgi:hypothetical protein